jgi:hypothetical protein
VKKCQTSSFRGAGTAREPETHEHRKLNILEIQVFLGSGLGPSGRPGMTFLGKYNFFSWKEQFLHTLAGRDLCRPWAPAFAGVTRLLVLALTRCPLANHLNDSEHYLAM